MKTYRFLRMVALISLLSALAACNSPPPTPSAADIQTAIAQTLTAAPTNTNTPTPPPENTPASSPTTAAETPTAIPGRPIDATIDVDFLNMRSGPGTFFDVIGTFEGDTQLIAMNRVADNSWVQVEIETDEETVTGWMFAEYLNFEGSVSQVSLMEFPPNQTITGLIQDENRNPIEGVVIVVVYSDDASDLIANATTDQTGQFTVYLPEDMTGILDVQVVNPLCGSELVDENCQVSSHILLNNREYISIPQENQEIIFVYETAAFTLTGTVLDNNMQPVEDINITAQRDDGAVSYGYTDANGDFALPISEGIWEIYAVEFNPRNEGDHLTITVADTLPDPVTLSAPD